MLLWYFVFQALLHTYDVYSNDSIHYRQCTIFLFIDHIEKFISGALITLFIMMQVHSRLGERMEQLQRRPTEDPNLAMMDMFFIICFFSFLHLQLYSSFLMMCCFIYSHGLCGTIDLSFLSNEYEKQYFFNLVQFYISLIQNACNIVKWTDHCRIEWKKYSFISCNLFYVVKHQMEKWILSFVENTLHNKN